MPSIDTPRILAGLSVISLARVSVKQFGSGSRKSYLVADDQIRRAAHHGLLLAAQVDGCQAQAVGVGVGIDRGYLADDRRSPSRR